ncbi:hypothetical protein [Haloarchaeobius baliensis]|uniref:hypothetical protein n=1 Tax=Haloarchaeobius baliensis TaxID=1670458 RepID=UPI003F883C16
MQDSPRRQVLRDIGAALSFSTVASVTSAATTVEADGSSAREPWRDGEEFAELLAFCPGSATQDEMVLSVADFEAMRESNRDQETTLPVEAFAFDSTAISKGVLLQHGQYGGSVPLLVLTGDLAFERDGETVTGPTGTEYRQYEADSHVAGELDDAVLVADSADRLDAALRAKAGAVDGAFDAEPVLEDGLDAFGDADVRSVMLGNSNSYAQAFDADVRFTGYGMTVRDPDTLERLFVVGLEDESKTDEVVDTYEQSLGADSENTSIETDGAVVTVTTVIDLAARRRAREHESPRGLRVDRDDIRDGDEYLPIEVREGDPTPVDELTLELDDEAYDRSIWAGDRETIAGGDTIRIRMADVEPNLGISLTHEQSYGTSTSTTTILGHLEFAFDYDFDARTLGIEYTDEFELDGDEIELVVHGSRDWWHRDAEEPEQTGAPWADETVTAGATATLDDVDPGEAVVVRYGDDEHGSGIAYFLPEPPGDATIDYDFDAREATVTLDLAEPRPASEYEVRVDDEPADTQWADSRDTVSSGASVTVDEVPVGATVAVVWGESAAGLAFDRVAPEIELDLTVGDEIALEHVAGDAVSASELTAHVWDGDRTVVELADEIDGEFAPGDTVPLGVDSVEHVSLLYDDEYYVAFATARNR